MQPTTTASPLHALLGRIARLEPGELPLLLASFFYYFTILTGYYIIRPVRDAMGTMVDRAELQNVFVVVFVVMLLAVPVFGYVVSTFQRRRIVPVIYTFFVSNLLLYWLFLRTGTQSAFVAKSFFVWVSVFNLFVMSLFWSVMSSTWNSDQGKRLFGVIAAGGTAGSLTGPLIAQSLATTLGPGNLLPIAAGFLLVAMLLATRLLSDRPGSADAEASPQGATLGTIFSGARRVWQSRYIFHMALWIFLANLVSTYFYVEQTALVRSTITDDSARVQFFARMDLIVSVSTLLIQVFVTARVLERYGIGVAAATLPAVAIFGFLAVSVWHSLWVVATVLALERAMNFALANPAAKVLYTVLDEDEKFKAQNFIDTVVYRGGDAVSGVYFDALAKAGLGIKGISLVTLPVAAVWFALSFRLARMFGEREAALSKKR